MNVEPEDIIALLRAYPEGLSNTGIKDALAAKGMPISQKALTVRLRLMLGEIHVASRAGNVAIYKLSGPRMVKCSNPIIWSIEQMLGDAMPVMVGYE